MKGKIVARWLIAGLLISSTGLSLTACKKKVEPPNPVDEPKPVELTVYSIKPGEGTTDKETYVTIMGSGFKEGAKAFVGDTALGNLQRAGEDSIRGTVPTGLKAGTFNVIVRNPDGKEAVLQRGFRLSEPQAPKPPAEPTECGLSPVYFDFDMSSLTDDARNTLQGDASCLKNKKVMSVTVEGHTDERGSTDYNLALGQRRADETRRYLSTLGISNIKTVSYGEERPASAGSDEDAWAKNRRAEVVIGK